MARLPRFILLGQPQHVIQCGKNRTKDQSSLTLMALG